jgi:hypothetical protein
MKKRFVQRQVVEPPRTPRDDAADACHHLMDLQRTAGNQAVLTWLARCNSRPTGTSENSVPTPTVQRGVQTIQQEGRKGKLYLSTWQQRVIDEGLSNTRPDVFESEKEAAVADREWKAFYESRSRDREARSVGSQVSPGSKPPTLTEVTQAKSRLRHREERSAIPPPRPARPDPTSSPLVSVTEKAQGRGAVSPPPTRPPRPARPELSSSPSTSETDRAQGRGLAPRPPGRSLQSGNGPQPQWNDLEPVLRSDLDDVWGRHQKEAYRTWIDLYEGWYKASDKKDGGRGGKYPPVGAKDVQTRIYINTTVQGERPIHDWVTQNIAPRPGVAAVKSGGPELAAWVRDVIVIYVSSDATVREVIQSLRRYPVKEHFVDELVRSTRGVSGLAGVGIGSDPPDVDLLQEEYLETKSPEWKESHDVRQVGRPSFSEYRARLIFQALVESDTDQQRFRQLVMRGFLEGGIDPGNPSKQGTPSPSVLERLGLVTEKRRIEAVVTSVEEKKPGGEVYDHGALWEVVEYIGPGEPCGPQQRPTYTYRAKRFE